MKWIVLLLLLAGGAYAYYTYMNQHPEVKACARFAELCGEERKVDCESAYEGLAKVAKPEDLQPSVKCLENATTCAAAAGCVTGAAAKAGANAAGEFLKGLGEAFGK